MFEAAPPRTVEPTRAYTGRRTCGTFLPMVEPMPVAEPYGTPLSMAEPMPITASTTNHVTDAYLYGGASVGCTCSPWLYRPTIDGGRGRPCGHRQFSCHDAFAGLRLRQNQECWTLPYRLQERRHGRVIQSTGNPAGPERTHEVNNALPSTGDPGTPPSGDTHHSGPCENNRGGRRQ